ncbi:hypothetical protein [Actinoplanes sp. CA-252034]|uniref:hypothetical protein n=1 Tax=Actinoplanes sp. CA-252034 TaxID=3239906 RepID=UPI003D95B893
MNPTRSRAASPGVVTDPESPIVHGDLPPTAPTAFPGPGPSDPVPAHAVRLSKEV